MPGGGCVLSAVASLCFFLFALFTVLCSDVRVLFTGLIAQVAARGPREAPRTRVCRCPVQPSIKYRTRYGKCLRHLPGTAGTLSLCRTHPVAFFAFRTVSRSVPSFGLSAYYSTKMRKETRGKIDKIKLSRPPSRRQSGQWTPTAWRPRLPAGNASTRRS